GNQCQARANNGEEQQARGAKAPHASAETIPDEESAFDDESNGDPASIEADGNGEGGAGEREACKHHARIAAAGGGDRRQEAQRSEIERGDGERGAGE